MIGAKSVPNDTRTISDLYHDVNAFHTALKDLGFSNTRPTFKDGQGVRCSLDNAARMVITDKHDHTIAFQSSTDGYCAFYALMHLHNEEGPEYEQCEADFKAVSNPAGGVSVAHLQGIC